MNNKDKTGLYLMVQPLLKNESPEKVTKDIFAALPPSPENLAYVEAIQGPTPMIYQRLSALRCLMLLLREFYPRALPSLRLSRDTQGRPLAEIQEQGHIPFDFNLSHTSLYVGCALRIGTQRIGLDIEDMIPMDRAKKLSTRFFTPCEQQYLSSIANESTFSHEATRIWTTKEALSKQDGHGFPIAFDSTADYPQLSVKHAYLLHDLQIPQGMMTLCVPVETPSPLLAADSLPVQWIN